MEEALKLYDEKIEIFRKMVRVTTNAKIDGTKKKEDEEAEDYIALMQKRKRFSEKLQVIDRKLESLGEIPPSELIDEKIKTIESMAEEVLELDKKHAVIAQLLMSHIKKSIKGINDGKNLNNLYQTDRIPKRALFDQKK